MAPKKTAENVSLPFPALQLLAPPVRLVSAAVWKTVQQRDVLQYGAVEEFVTSVCDSVPGMLTCRHQGKLALGLRGRMILELLIQDQPDQEAIGRHLERFKAPAPSSSAHKPKRDVKIERTVSCFQELVDTLLRDPAERLQFFKEEFQEEYGSTFDQELEKLLWEFLIRLDQLLPVPNLAQTVSWLSAAPPVLEECARAATQPQLLKTILQYQTCLGHLEPAASLPPKMGDSILTSLSLPPSGKPPPPSAGRGTRAAENKTPFIAPIIGRILNEDVPAMISASKKRAREQEEEQQEEEQQEEEEEEEEEEGSKRSNRAKRKQPDDSEEEEEGADAQEEEMPVGRGASKGRRRKRRRSLKKRSRVSSGSQSLSEDGAGDPDPAGPASGGAPPAADPALRAAFSSCLLRQPTVLLRRVDAAAPGTSPGAANTNANVEAARSDSDSDDDDDDDGGGERERSAGVRPKKTVIKNAAGKPAPQPPLRSDNKENCHVLPGITSSPTLTEDHPTQGDDIIGDSEDEATKNFKVRLFAKRYRKTKHDTYVPTLREFWKPWMARPGLLSPR